MPGMMRRAYQTDLSDAEWALIEPIFPPQEPQDAPALAPLARDPRRGLLRGAWRLYLAFAPARLPALEDRLPLLSSLAHRRHLGAVARGPSPKGPGTLGEKRTTYSRHHRFTERQDHRGGR